MVAAEAAACGIAAGQRRPLRPRRGQPGARGGGAGAGAAVAGLRGGRRGGARPRGVAHRLAAGAGGRARAHPGRASSRSPGSSTRGKASHARSSRPPAASFPSSSRSRRLGTWPRSHVASAAATPTTAKQAGSRPASTSSATSRCSPPARRRARRSTTWTFTITGADRRAARVDLGRVPGAARARRSRRDIHCVTTWSKLDTRWEGVSVDTLLDGVETEARLRHRLLRRRLHDEPAARGPHRRQGVGRLRATTASRCEPEHGGPARLLVPHLYFWKSAKWVRGLTSGRGRAGLLGDARLPRPRRPVARAALPGRLTRGRRPTRRGRSRDGRRRRARRRRAPRTLVARRPRLARPPRRPARRRPADRRGRLPGAAQLLDRLGARGRAASRSPSSGSTTARSRRTSPTSVRVGDQFEVRGPIGGWFVWDAERGRPAAADRRRLGLVPLMCDAAPPRRARAATCRAQLLLSARRGRRLLYARRARPQRLGVDLVLTLTRARAAGLDGPRPAASTARCSRGRAAPAARPRTFVCGPTAFVESVATALVALGHAPASGPSASARPVREIACARPASRPLCRVRPDGETPVQGAARRERADRGRADRRGRGMRQRVQGP